MAKQVQKLEKIAAGDYGKLGLAGQAGTRQGGIMGMGPGAHDEFEFATVTYTDGSTAVIKYPYGTNPGAGVPVPGLETELPSSEDSNKPISGNALVPDGSGGYKPAYTDPQDAKDKQAARDHLANTDARTDRKDAQDQANFDYEQRVAAWDAQVKAGIEAARVEQDRFRNLLEQGKIESADAQNAFNNWWQQNVALPFQQGQEARQRAADQRAVETEQRRRLEAAAADDTARTKFGYDAGRDAVADEKFMVPYAVGPGFNDHMSGAINALQSGKGGANFSGDDFRVRRPNFEGAAHDATARALAQWSPYAARIAAAGKDGSAGTPLTVADYSGIKTPDMSQAPVVPKTKLPPVPGGYDPNAAVSSRPVYPGAVKPAPAPAAAPAPAPSPAADAPSPQPLGPSDVPLGPPMPDLPPVAPSSATPPPPPGGTPPPPPPPASQPSTQPAPMPNLPPMPPTQPDASLPGQPGPLPQPQPDPQPLPEPLPPGETGPLPVPPSGPQPLPMPMPVFSPGGPALMPGSMPGSMPNLPPIGPPGQDNRPRIDMPMPVPQPAPGSTPSIQYIDGLPYVQNSDGQWVPLQFSPSQMVTT